jgi:hypothetical protein
VDSGRIFAITAAIRPIVQGHFGAAIDWSRKFSQASMAVAPSPTSSHLVHGITTSREFRAHVSGDYQPA